MRNPANPAYRMPGLPAHHTPLRLTAPRVLVVEDEMTAADADRGSCPGAHPGR
jgi:hypothetical protein